MLFNIFVISLIVVAVISVMLCYSWSDSWDASSNASLAVFLTVVVGGMILLVIMIGASEAAKDNPDNHVVKTEKTHTVVENSVPTYKDSELEFSYTENGQVFPFEEYVDEFEVGFEKPKAFKVTEYRVVDHGIAFWDLGEGIKVEVIK